MDDENFLSVDIDILTFDGGSESVVENFQMAVSPKVGVGAHRCQRNISRDFHCLSNATGPIKIRHLVAEIEAKYV